MCALFQAFHESATVKNRPTAVLAKTLKGKSFPGIEDLVNWHGAALGAKGADVIKVRCNH